MPEATDVLYLPRSFWTDVEPGGHLVPEDQIKRMVIHHTVFVMSDYDKDGYLNGDLDDIKRYMVRLSEARPDLYWQGRPEVPYSFVHFYGGMEWLGIVVEGRGPYRTGAHTANWNSKVYGCAFAGNANEQKPTRGLVESFRHIGSKYNLTGATWGHRDAKATECPGDYLYDYIAALQPPFPDVEVPMAADSLDFGMRNNGDRRVYLLVGDKWKMRMQNPVEFERTKQLTGLTTNLGAVRKFDPLEINKRIDLVDDPADG